MISLDVLIVTMAGLHRAEVEHWIEADWLRPAALQGTWLFDEIDVARLRLIRELRDDLGLREDAIPIVLRLLDQLYDERRRLLVLRDVLDRNASKEVREAVLEALERSAET
ncbi:chaperone modulator CbpM [Lichenihabitans psoromatis]|uniref:chaperone modulator CbpM n=1 Tax=Lichenihabitans psoromatis TaxID=2528642 RepID=UPI001035922B|nr:chaperone modulator CbpM [Lichenihabitans psoromatis]